MLSRTISRIIAPIVAGAALLAGCASTPAAAPDPQTAFMARLCALGGKAFAGRVVRRGTARDECDQGGRRMTGQMVMEKASLETWDLGLTDRNMPKMDGLQLIKHLRELPAYAKTPILMLTTESSDEMKAKGRAAGANGWLVKPFDPQRLIEVVKKVIG